MVVLEEPAEPLPTDDLARWERQNGRLAIFRIGSRHIPDPLVRPFLAIAEYMATKAAANVPKLQGHGYSLQRATAIEQAATNLDENIEKYRDKWATINRAVQAKYDADSKHGKNPVGQRDWSDNYKAKADAIAKENGWGK